MEFDIRKMQCQDAQVIESIRALFLRSGIDRSTSHYQWTYAGTNGFFPHVHFAYHGEKVAGMYATVPQVFQCGSSTVLACQSLDTLVDAGYRGCGLFTKLADKTYADLRVDDISFVYGFPNGNSFHGFVTKLDWLVLDPVPFLFRPIKLSYFLQRWGLWPGWLPSPRIPIVGPRDISTRLDGLPSEEKTNRLWERFSAQIKVGRVRDYRFLFHRYMAKPDVQYLVRVCMNDAELEGLIIYCAERKHGGVIGYVMELMTIPDRPRVAACLVSDALRDLSQAGCDGVLAWCFEHSPSYRVFLKQLFFPLPESVRPIELHFGCGTFDQGLQELLSERRNWYISYSDSDTV